MSVAAQLAPPLVVPDAASQAGTRIQPLETTYRTAVLQMTTPAGRHLHTRMMAIGHFYFYLSLPNTTLGDADFERGADDVDIAIPNSVRLRPEVPSVRLQTSSHNPTASLAFHVVPHADAYRDFFRRKSH